MSTGGSSSIHSIESDFPKGILSKLADVWRAEFTFHDVFGNSVSSTGIVQEAEVANSSLVSVVRYSKEELAVRYQNQLALQTTLQKTETELLQAILLVLPTITFVLTINSMRYVTYVLCR